MADDEERDGGDREAILRRRSRLIAVALGGLVSGTTQACACLSAPYEPYDAGRRDAGRDAATADGGGGSDAGADSGSGADSGTDAGAADDAGNDASVSQDGGPLPCLTPLPPDAGPDATVVPVPCLSTLPPDGGFET
ncbi:MAG: hypothetical protein M5U28_25805 [Sandaracinaceae bacterium]|nr:hypothetical protein [Sandaracinaceae bacterium]